MHITKTELPKSVWYSLFLILILSLILNIYHNNFSSNLHADESFKLALIKDHSTPFLHPMFMVQLIKIVNALLPFFPNLKIISRTVSALCGTTTVLLIFFLAKKNFKDNYFALLTALALAVSPILVIHSHYIKESIYFTMCELFFLLQLINYTQKQSTYNTLLLGLALGLSISSEYIGCLSLLLLLTPPFLNPALNKKYYFKSLIYICIIASGIFLLINYPLLLDPHQFWNGLTQEVIHAEQGHLDIKIYAADFYWSFHLVHSIVPGITLIVTALAIIGMIIIICNWKKELTVNKILFLYIILFYFVEETSPLKPYPDFQRYMLCITPALIFFAVLTVQKIYLHFYQSRKTLAVAITSFFALTGIIYPLYISANLDYYLTKDTRIKAEKWMLTKQNVLFGRYSKVHLTTIIEKPRVNTTILDLMQQAKAQHARYFVTSSFAYQRYLDALTFPHQQPNIYQSGKQYQWLFKHFHFIELKPAFRTDAFSNPTIRIIDLQRPK